MSEKTEYNIQQGVKFGYSTKISIPGEVAACTDTWFNQTLTTVNDSHVRMGIFEGEFHWHKHDNEDEFFLVLDGEFLLDIEGSETIVLRQHEGYTVPKGVVHRTRSPKKSVVLMIEQAGVVPTGDV
ncbi:MAG: cupin domain-containing protein [Vulcanimicrobiaceae bacterium]